MVLPTGGGEGVGGTVLSPVMFLLGGPSVRFCVGEMVLGTGVTSVRFETGLAEGGTVMFGVCPIDGTGVAGSKTGGDDGDVVTLVVDSGVGDSVTLGPGGISRLGDSGVNSGVLTADGSCVV